MVAPKHIENLLYEPRGFWDVRQVSSAVQPTQIRFDQANFFNGEKYPVTLYRLTLAPVGYTFRTYANPAVAVPTLIEYHNDAIAALTRSQIQINAPGRQHYSKRDLLIPSWGTLPTWEPRNKTDGTNASGDNSPAFASSLWNVGRWDFAHSLVMPRLGYLELDLASFPGVLGLTPDDAIRPIANIGFQETGATGADYFVGNQRVTRVPLEFLNTTGPDAITPPFFAPDAFGFAASPGTSTLNWPPTSSFRARDYDAQNVSNRGPTQVLGFKVQIDQIDYDNAVSVTGDPSGTGLNPVNSLLFNVASRVRLRNSGTGAWWWRPGAPLALMMPTMTPALTYELPVPITLGPGDTLEVELTVPAPVTIDGNLLEPNYQLGIGFCGEAVIEA